MKKLIPILFMLLVPCVSFAMSPYDEDDNVMIHYSNATVDTSTTVIAIDLSDTTNWKHKYTGNIVISAIRCSIDRTGSSGVTSSTGTVKLGVVNSVDLSTGSVTWFYEFPFLKGGSFTTPVVNYVNYSPSFLKLKAIAPSAVNTDGSTPYIVSSDLTSGNAAYQTDLNLPTILATQTPPGLGDILLSLTEVTAGQYAIALEIFYHSKR